MNIDSKKKRLRKKLWKKSDSAFKKALLSQVDSPTLTLEMLHDTLNRCHKITVKDITNG